jgi:hypothetical protein
VLPYRPFRPCPKKALWWIEKISLMTGLVALILCGAINLNTYLFQKKEKAYLAQILLARHNSQEMPPPPLNNGGLIGEIDIPCLGISAVILNGSDERSLSLGVGHIPGTAFPDEPGNVSLAAHRDTFDSCLSPRSLVNSRPLREDSRAPVPPALRSSRNFAPDSFTIAAAMKSQPAKRVNIPDIDLFLTGPGDCRIASRNLLR